MAANRNPQPAIVLATLAAGLLAAALPFYAGNQYLLHIGTLICIYWILISGLTLVIGYLGQLSIGHVGLLALGAYTFAILQGRLGLSPELALVAAGVVGGFAGILVGLPSLRLPGFYFAMSTLAFSMIVIEIATARADITGGGAGLATPRFGAPFDSEEGFYWLALALALAATFVCWNLARGRFGRAMIAIRDSDVTATSVGIRIPRVKLAVFTISGVLAGLAGALFGSLQSYITTETFHLDLGLFFFICVVIGGANSIVGPFLGTIVLTALPEVVTSFAAVSGLIYGFILLAIVLAIPGGLKQAISSLAAKLKRRPAPVDVVPELDRLRRCLGDDRP